MRVNQWGYDWGYSNAYIELMCIDTTIVEYPKIKENNSIDKEALDETLRIWRQQQEKEKKTISLKE